ncbi:MAG: FISUMP domain-containing protein [Crocinitomicaceae bacterium]|nr:FISUMP domain-containing protein [Crocinitomicaceae bacterium]
MKTITLLITLLTLSSSLFAQKLSKEEKQAYRQLYPRLWRPTLKVLNGMDDRGYETYYTNKVTSIEYAGISEEYTAKKAELEKYFISGLLPLRYVGKTSEEGIHYFQDGWAYADSYYNMHLKRYQTLSKDVTLNRIYDFQTENGPALVVETKKKDADKYFYGLILLDDMTKLMDKVEKNEIGVFEDERDGAYYKWSKIGEQIWMAENLKYKLEEHTAMESELGWSVYKGKFYNYSQAMTSCPKGWHLPSDAEWKELELIAGVWPRDINVEGAISREGIDTLPGNELIGSERLMFFAHLAGSVSKSFSSYSDASAGQNGYFWTSTKSDEVNAMIRMVGKDFTGIVRDKLGAQNYFSCRCMQDQDISVIVEKYPSLKEATDKINADPTNASNYFDRSVEFLLLGEGKRAMDDINKATELDPNDPELKLFKAQILYQYSFDLSADETRKLVDDYTASIKDNPYAYYFQSKLWLYEAEGGALTATYDQDKRDKSLEGIKKALELDPKNPQFLDYHAKLLVVFREYSNAVKALKKAVLSDPNNGDLRILLGKMMLKNYDEYNKNNGSTSQKWCTAMTGRCFKINTKQLGEVCRVFVKGVELGANLDPDYRTLCNELEQAKTLKKHAPIVYIGPRGGRYTINSNGNKCYIPRR